MRKLPGQQPTGETNNPGNLVKLSPTRSILKFFLYGLVLAVLADVPSTNGTFYHAAQAVLITLTIATFFLPPKRAILLLFLMTLAGPDLVSPSENATVVLTASIWQLYLGPIRPSWLMFTCLFAQIIKLKGHKIPTFIKVAIFWFLTIPIITGLVYGGFFSEYAGVAVPADLKFPLMLLLTIVMFLSLLRKHPTMMPVLVYALVGTLLARHFIDQIYVFLNLGPMITEGISRGSVDSAKGCIVFLIFFSMILAWKSRKKFLGSIVAILCLVLMAAYGTRTIWITCFMGLILFLIVGKFRHALLFTIIAGILVTGSVWTLNKVNPEMATVLLARSKTITEGHDVKRVTLNIPYNTVSRMDPTRYAEMLNIWNETSKRFSYLWGSGYGGYYHDDAVRFDPTDISAFPQYSFRSGLYYTAHGYLLVIFFKYGLLGLIIITNLWFFPSWSIFKLYRKRDMLAAGQPLILHYAMLALLLFMPTAILQLYWSGKGLFINGAILALCLEFVRQYSAPMMRSYK